MQEPQVFTFSIDQENKGTRIDLVLSLQLEEVSRSFIQKLIEQGNVRVNGNRELSKKYKVAAGDEIQLILPPAEEIEARPEDIPLDIVYEDEELLVVNKPRGMVVHPAPGNESGTLVNALLWHCKGKLSSINGKMRPGIVHRIDKDTSGLLVVAKSDIAHRALSAQLAEHSITRKYEALVYDNFSQDEGTVDAPIGRDPNNRLRQAVITDGHHTARRAVTHWSVKERFGKMTLIQAVLETGRTHQIRVHMAYIRHPLVGDMTYGPRKQHVNVEGQLLHAGVLGFVHPVTGGYMEFSCPKPDIFESVLAKLRNGVK